MAHLIAQIHAERTLCGETRLERTGVVMPFWPCAEAMSVFRQPVRGVFLRIRRDRHEMHLPGFVSQPVLKLREDLAHQRTNGPAGREDEIQQDGTAVVHLRWQ